MLKSESPVSSTRPRVVLVAIWLIAITLAFGVGNLLIWSPRSAEGIAITTLLVVAGLLVAIARRRNWARSVWTVTYVVGIPLAIPFIRLAFDRSPVFGVIQVTQ